MEKQIQKKHATQRHLRIGKWQVSLFPANAYQADYIASSATIGFAFDAQTGAHAYASDRVRPFRASPDTLAFVPKDCDVFSESVTGGEYLCLSHDDGIPLIGESSRIFNNVRDKHATYAAHAIRQLLLQSPMVEALVFERHANTLADGVGDASAAKAKSKNRHTPMTESRLSMIDKLIEQHLAERLSVGYLAKTLGVSEGYFSRAFRASVGKSPFDYIIDCRVRRARCLITRGDENLSGIAMACGFSSHSHMTETFRQRIGLSPSKLV